MAIHQTHHLPGQPKLTYTFFYLQIEQYLGVHISTDRNLMRLLFSDTNWLPSTRHQN